ncbi:hypothetical protein [Crenobacter caeni]|uniref:TubC N-terminal docking domain-containing protein n=1 Tax=Crenobacter caeni TaxID=2705474 RepID=A0A6B2KN95_9NEIS|nr:hypothetical protein [Crenobacter caeni]NDV11706.1 hypothetical protein [Crenobacter caeni]
MSAARIIKDVIEAGATIKVEDGRLLIRPASVVPDLTVAALKAHKLEVIEALAPANDPIPPSPIRPTIRFRLGATSGGNTGGTVIGDDLPEMVRELVERYGSRLDLDDLQERAAERFAIAAESSTDAEAQRIAMAEIVAAIQSAKHN